MLEAAREQRADGVDVRRRATWRPTGGPRRKRCSPGSRSFPPRTSSTAGPRCGSSTSTPRSRAAPPLILVDELAHTNAPGLAARQALAGRRGAARRGHRRLHDAQRPAPREPERRRGEDHRRRRAGDGAGLGVRAGRRGRADRPAARRPPASASRTARSTCPTRPRRPSRNFFRKGNLIALRELALRRTAERVDAQMRVYRREHAIEHGVADGRAHPRLRRPEPVVGAAGARGQADGRPARRASGSPPTSRRRPSCGCRRGARPRHADAAAGRAARRRDGHADAARRMSEAILAFARDRNVSKIVVGKPRALASGSGSCSARSSTRSCRAAATSTSTSSAASASGGAAPGARAPGRVADRLGGLRLGRGRRRGRHRCWRG